jgi:DNA-directed RNA polymerase subunit RPC12/RpoP
MPRILLLIVLVWVLYRVIKRVIAIAKPMPKKPSSKQVENFVKCVRCGLHIPESESLIKDNQITCNNPKCNDTIPTK